MQEITIKLSDQIIQKIEKFKSSLGTFQNESIPEESRLQWMTEETIPFLIEQSLDQYFYLKKVKNPFPIKEQAFEK